MTLINQHILMSDAENFSIDQPINPYYRHELVDKAQACREHSAIKNLLNEAGVKMTTVPSPTDSQDGVYTANWALVRGDKAVLASLPNARKNEENYAKEILTDLGKTVIHLPAGLKFSGQGDALACGDFLFCGSNYRSDPEAQQFAAEILGYERVQLQTIPLLGSDGNQIINSESGWADSYFYDLDLALAIIKAPDNDHRGLIAYCPEAFTSASRALLASFDTVDKIEVSIEEARKGFATNLVSTGDTIVMSAHTPELATALQQRGLRVLTPEITELAKGGGYIRCVTLTID